MTKKSKQKFKYLNLNYKGPLIVSDLRFSHTNRDGMFRLIL